MICNGGVSCAYSLLFVAVQKHPVFILSAPRGIDASWLFLGKWSASCNSHCFYSYILAITGSIAGAAADTWASEVGTVVGFSNKKKKSEDKEMKKERLRYCRLVVWPWKKVPRGTNGGVSILGLVAAFAGALIVSVSAAITLYFTSGLPYDNAEDKNIAWALIISLTLTGNNNISHLH